jgi:TolA-binding protein
MTALRAPTALILTAFLAGPALGQIGAPRQRGPLPPALTSRPNTHVVPQRSPFVPRRSITPTDIGLRNQARMQGITHGRPSHGHQHPGHQHGHHQHGAYPKHRLPGYTYRGVRYPYSSSLYYFSTTPYYVASPTYYEPAYTYDPGVSALQTQNELLQQQLEALRIQNAQLQQGAPIPPNANNALVERNQARYQQAMSTGTRLFEMGSYSRAAEKFEEAARNFPDDATPRFFQAQALFASGQYAQAVSQLKTALKINPQWVHVDFDMRSLYKEPDEMVRQITRLAPRLKANPLDRDSLFLLGFELFTSGEKEKAKAVFEQAERLEPGAEHLKPFLDFYKANP